MKQCLDGLFVLDFSQYLSGPSAALRLADLGARVIKIERPQGGDGCRKLTNGKLMLKDDSILFHTINRNKESFAADLKNEDNKTQIIKLIQHADVLIQNFRPGIMQKLGLDYDAIKTINPKLIYASVSGYGSSGAWAHKPGQDLLVQSVSGIPFLNGNADQPPVPFGLAIADMFAGAHLVQGILACLVRRSITGKGGYVEVSLLESMLDFQFEVLTTYLNDGQKLPQRSAINNAHAYLGAPYGIYKTKDGYLALAMGSVLVLKELLECDPLADYTSPDDWFDKRDEIKLILTQHLKTQTTDTWLSKLEPHDYWCSDVLSWDKLFAHEGFKSLEMIQTLEHSSGTKIQTTRCPIMIDGQRIYSPKAAPSLGENTNNIKQQFDLD